MKVEKIRTFEDPALSTRSEDIPVEEIKSEEIRNLISTMKLTSYTTGGYGLAAPQIGVNKRIFVYRKAVDSDKYKVVINPTIIVSSGKLVSKGEGCLSVPGFRKDIKRSKSFIIRGLDENGDEIRIKPSTKMETIILQHEFDHLEGITINDRE